MVTRSRIGIFFTILTFSLACGKVKKNHRSGDDGEQESEDQEAVQAVDIGESFSVEGKLSESNKFSLTKSFGLKLKEAKTLRLNDQGGGSACLEGTKLAGPEFAITNDDGSVKLATTKASGYTRLDAKQFPGKLPAGNYVLTVSFNADNSCGINYAYSFVSVEVNNPPPPPAPTPKELDPAVVGNWVMDAGFYKANAQYNSNGTSRQMLQVQGETYVDANSTFETNTAVTPRRLREVITKINVLKPGQSLAVGDVGYCIYETTANTLKLECSDSAYPAAFSPDANTYTRQ